MNFVFVVGYLLVWSAQLVSCRLYKSIYWSPRNPQFAFTPEEFKSGKAFAKKAVKPDSKIYVVCPNPATIENAEVDTTVLKEEMYENLLIVDKDSFQSCSVGNKDITKNKRILNCNSPLQLKYHTLVFQKHNAEVDGLEFEPGKKYYFIATSNGSKSSLHHTSGGHCYDVKNGVAMRIEFYVCRDENDTTCNQEEGSTSSSPTLRPVVSDVRSPAGTHTEKSEDIWRILVIAFGAALGVSLIVIVVICRVACVLKSRSKRVQQPEGNV